MFPHPPFPMKTDCHTFSSSLALAAALALSMHAPAQLPTPQPQGLDQQRFAQGQQFYAAGKYPEAIKAFDGIQKDYPTSAFIPAANLQLGLCYFFAGDFDQGVAALRKNLSNKNLTGEIVEDSQALVPQLLSAKAQKLPPGERKPVLESAVAEFDAFIQKFPQSPEIEQANLGKARSLYGLEKFEDAAVPLHTNLQKYPASESVLETQYMLALILNTQGNETMRKATTEGEDKTAVAAYDEAETLLRTIVGKRTDLAMMNDAQFQLGEMLSARGSFKGSQNKDAIFYKALDAYRNTYSNEVVVQAQTARIKRFQELMADAGAKRDVAGLRHYQALIVREQGKLAELGQRPDQTLAAKIKSAQLYLELHKDKDRERMDEARVLYHFVDKFTKDPEQQKQILNGLTLTYAAQHLPEKAEEHFTKWITAFNNDPMGENLPLLMGAMYLDPDPKVNNPKKAIEYFDKQATLFPTSKFTGEAAMQSALALIQLKQYEEAAEKLKAYLGTNPPKEQAVGAEFGLAIVYKDTNQAALAVEAFRAVRNKYPATEQAEQAGYWVGQLLYGKGDAKAAVTELKEFIAKNAASELVPAAMLTLGQAQRDAGQRDAAVKTWMELAEKHAAAEAAPYSYFQRAALLHSEQKYDELKVVMKDFVAKYPENDRVFGAYDYVAQIQSLQEKKLEEAIKSYEEYAAKYPNGKDAATAFVKVSDLWKKMAEGMGRFITIPQASRETWRKYYDTSVEAAEKVLEKYPESGEVAPALQNLLKAQEQLVIAKLKADANVENYFNDIAKKFAEKPTLVSKIKFTLAGYFAEKDKPKALKMMKEAFDPALVYAPSDLESYAEALIEQKQYDDADKVADKLVKDFPLPKNGDPATLARSITEPTATSLFIKGKVLQNTGKNAEAASVFAQLKREYPWSPKLLEADLGIGIDLFMQKKYDESIKLIAPVAKATAGPVEIRAKAMMTLGQISEAEGDIDTAINNYIKIATFFEGVPEFAAEGLWRGAQLQEKKASGEVKQVPKATPAPEKKAEPEMKASEKKDAK